MNNSRRSSRLALSLGNVFLGTLVAVSLALPARADTYGWMYTSDGTDNGNTNVFGSGMCVSDWLSLPVERHNALPTETSTWIGAAIANSPPYLGGSADAKVMGYAIATTSAYWGDLTTGQEGGIPTTGISVTTTALSFGVAMAAASYSTNGTTGAITPVGSASATVSIGGYDGPFPSDSTIGLPDSLQADSNSEYGLVDPPGRATSSSSGGVDPSGAYTDYGAHLRGGAYIFQNGDLVWGENVDTGVAYDVETITVSPSAYQNGYSSYANSLVDIDESMEATSADGSAALTSGYLLAVTSATSH